MSGYENGAFKGGLSSISSPIDSWVRLRVWKMDEYVMPNGFSRSIWGVWILNAGVDKYVGSIDVEGKNLTTALLFDEIYEADGPCTTNVSPVWFQKNVYRSQLGGPFPFGAGFADYENRCSNTDLRRVGGPSEFDYALDERNVTRSTPQGQRLWP